MNYLLHHDLEFYGFLMHFFDNKLNTIIFSGTNVISDNLKRYIIIVLINIK